MFSAFFGRTPSVFGDPMSEPEAFGFNAKQSTAPSKPTEADQRGRVVGQHNGKLLVKMESTGRVLSVDPTDIVRVVK